MSTFKFVVEVETENEQLARRVMSERIGYEEDYGFPYRIDWKGEDE